MKIKKFKNFISEMKQIDTESVEVQPAELPEKKSKSDIKKKVIRIPDWKKY